MERNCLFGILKMETIGEWKLLFSPNPWDLYIYTQCKYGHLEDVKGNKVT